MSIYICQYSFIWALSFGLLKNVKQVHYLTVFIQNQVIIVNSYWSKCNFIYIYIRRKLQKKTDYFSKLAN